MSFQCVSSGFRQDMEDLFSRFWVPEDKRIDGISNDVKTYCLRFSQFSRCWRQMNFSLVFRHRFHENDLREFVEEIFLVVLPNICTEYPYERRVCSLYLLYCLFVKQPQNICQKIRINFSFLLQFRELIKKSKELEQMDVCYVWYKLLSLGAIDLVLVSRNMGPYFIRNSRVTTGLENRTDFFVNQFKTSICLPFSDLNQIHEKYDTIKKELSEEMPTIGEECNLIDNIFDLNNAMKCLMSNNRDKQLENSSHRLVDNTAKNGLNQNQEIAVQDIGSKRRQLKERALNCKTNTDNVSNRKTTQKIERRYGPITRNEPQTEKRKKASRNRGRPKVAKLNAIL